MALTACKECGQEMSTEATTCPKCGHPNKSVINKAQNSRQGTGCFIMLLGLIALVFAPWAGAVLLIVGLVLVVINTRFS